MMYVVASSAGWQLRTVVLDHLAYGLKPQWILVGRNVSICVLGQGMIVWLHLGFIHEMASHKEVYNKNSNASSLVMTNLDARVGGYLDVF